MKRYSKVLCMVMAVCLLLGLLPVAASAAPTITPLAPGAEKSVTMGTEENAYLYFSFTPSESGNYSFYSICEGDLAANLYLASDLDNSIASDDDSIGYDFVLQVDLEANTEYVYRVRSLWSGQSITGKVGLQKTVAAQGIVFETDNTVVDLFDYPYFKAYCSPRWSVQEEIEYSVDKSGVFKKTDDGDIYAAKVGKGKITAKSVSGKKKTLTFTVPEPQVMTLGTYEWTDIMSENSMYKFVAPKTADYIFYPKSVGRADCDIYDSTGKSIEESGRDSYGTAKWFSAKKGKTYYIDMDFDFCTGEEPLTYVFAEKKAASSVSVPATLTMAVGEYLDARYFYTVKPRGAAVDLPEITSDNTSVVAVEYSYDVYAEKAGTATLTFDFGSLGKKQVTVTVVEPTALVLNQTKTRTATNWGMRDFEYKFTPSESGTYYVATFKGNGEAYIGTDGDYSEQLPVDVYAYRLEKDRTYTVYVSCNYIKEPLSFGIFTKNGHDCIKKGHSFKKNYTIAATTENWGLVEYSCTRCGVLDWKHVEKRKAKSNTSKVFKDVNKSDWFYKSGAIDFVYNSGLFSGTSKTTFEANAPMTRGMFVTVLGRLAGIKQNKNAKTKFKDVGKEYYTGYVKWASDNGIVDGTSKTTFGPDENITREQICKMMVEFANYIEVPLRSDTPAVTFKDAKKISKWARPYVAKCQKAGIISGEKAQGGYNFRPQGNATRAEVATIVYNFAKTHLNYWT